jgi:hypothetical protein
MSFTKQAIEKIRIAASSIQVKTLDDNDLTEILNSLNLVIDIKENIIDKDNLTEFYWNEIISELIAVIYSSISGYSRLGLSGLRTILELLCHAFFYYDHPIELKLSINENMKADKYVTTLVSEYHFFTTRYIKTFKSDIMEIQTKQDSVSEFLKSEYRTLCDVVHGRHSTLTKSSSMKIDYSKPEFKKFESHFIKITRIIANLYVLRFDDYSNTNIIEHAKKLDLINY